MIKVTVSKFEPQDLHIPRWLLGGKAKLIAWLLVLIASTGLMTTGAVMIGVRHGLLAIPFAAPAVMGWLMLALIARGLLRFKPADPAIAQRHATVLSPMEIEFGDDRVTVSTPTGYSKIRYPRILRWKQTPAACYLIVKEQGIYVIPRRCVAPADLAAAAEALRARGVRIR